MLFASIRIPIEPQTNGVFIRDLYCIEALRRLDTFPSLEAAHLSLRQVSDSQEHLLGTYRSVIETDAIIIDLLKRDITNERMAAADLMRKEKAKAFGVGAVTGGIVATIIFAVIVFVKK